MGFDPHLPAHLLQLLTSEEAEHDVQLLLADHRSFDRESAVPSLFTVMRAILAPPYSVSNSPGRAKSQ